jgi:ubiquinone biosynthesis protein
MAGVERYRVPTIDWDRTCGSVMTMEWVDGVKVSDHDALRAAGHDLPELARRLVIAFLTQAIHAGYFHADMHQGNLFIQDDGTIAAIDFGIMGRINRQARVWLGEILHGLTTGNYRRVAEIHFEAQYVPSYHSVEEFATALRAVGEPMRGKPVKDLSVGQMLDGLFAITRDFDMVTQPHLLLLQKTMVMVEGWPPASIQRSTCGMFPAPSSRHGCVTNWAPRPPLPSVFRALPRRCAACPM